LRPLETQKEHDMADFKPGDLVHLKSGGPIMTVNGLEPATQELVCLWFSGDDLERGVFSQAAVAEVEEDEDEDEEETE
jgi:uncharacterized protein YodC (DUF2158 family)